MDSLFRRLSRYPPTPSTDPRENRLTETTAAVLERVDGLPQAVVVALLTAAIDALELDSDAATGALGPVEHALQTAHTACSSFDKPRVDVRTQVATPRGRFVDLSIRLRHGPPDGSEDILVWLEVKYGSDLHGEQLDVYLQEIDAQPAAHRIVLLVKPRGQEIKGVLPTRVRAVDFQVVSGIVAAFVDSPELPDEQSWLLDEYADYLDEEGLMDPQALSATHAVALMELGAAADAVAGVCEHAHATIEAGWGKLTEQATSGRAAPVPVYGLGYWEAFDARPASPNWRGGWYGWGVGEPDDWQYFDDAPRGSTAFFAGAGFDAKPNPYKEAGNESWIATLVNQGFRWCWFGSSYQMIRVKYPDELLVATTLDHQGLILGQWVIETFRLLEAHPPPH